MTATKTTVTQKPTKTSEAQVGARVLYTLTASDAQYIDFRREARTNYAASGVGHDTGAQVHIGNPTYEGQIFPAVIVAVSGDTANLQVWLDGFDSYWRTSATEGTEPGQWTTTLDPAPAVEIAPAE